ncbi:tumor necrosis factor receptor superfamily member 1A-like isoform X2 [Liolophura sinensis]|uniref:tumor necrosis factor receptor superfamily member 1A-like isoform X2 n=1 Tax=Liolophura sinensis TaxID=3198878 RepID=UPI0031586987
MIGFLLLTSIHIQTVETAVISTSTVSRCGIGFFQESWPNGSESCLPCSRCPVNSVETQTCADDHDTICSCPEGKYLFKGQCRTCRKCRRGSGVTQKCQGENNTICKPCIRGAFSAKKSHVTTCQKCRQCDPHEARVRKCTTTSDTICGDCKKERRTVITGARHPYAANSSSYLEMVENEWTRIGLT